MASIKIKLRSQKKLNLQYPVVLQIIKDRKRKVISTGLECPWGLWDHQIGCFKTKHLNSRQNNQLLDQLKIRARNIISQYEIEELDFTLKEFENKFRIGRIAASSDLLILWSSVIQEMTESGKMGNARVNKDTLRSFKKFIKRDNISLKDVNVTLLETYEVYLRSSGGTDGGIGVKMRALRAVYNTAIRRGLIKESFYPFKQYKVSRLKGCSPKQALSFNEIQTWRKIDCLKDKKMINAKNYFLFSFYTRGMNFTDMMLLKWSNVGSDRIQYIRSKTKGLFSIKITDPVREILDFYKMNALDTKYVFPILLHNNLSPQQIENRKHKILSEYNSNLKILAEKSGINKNITSYVARHSYAMCLREKGVGIDVIGESLGHQNVATTKAYVKDFGIDLLDQAVDLLY